MRLIGYSNSPPELFGRSMAERARALIAIAHPDFREELRLAAKQLHLDR